MSDILDDKSFSPFLLQVAEDLKRKANSNPDLSDYTVVFPNKRASLFFNRHLFKVYNPDGNDVTPVLSPKSTSIGELFRDMAAKLPMPLRVPADADKLQLVYILYLVYKQVYEAHLEQKYAEGNPVNALTKTFDEFYFFGEMLLKDFDDIDKNLVDADRLYINFAEYNSLDFGDFLTPEQKEALHVYFNRPNEETVLYRNFISLWEVLGDIYSQFQNELQLQGLAYEGMLERKVVEMLDSNTISLPSDNKLIFVGFNALNLCEKTFFKVLTDKNNAQFYWDYDDSYFSKRSVENKVRLEYKDDAGTFLKENLCGIDKAKTKPNAKSLSLKLNDASADFNHNMLSRLKDGNVLKVKTASSDVAMAKYVSTYLSDLKSKGVKDDDIAIVLCDESLLLPIVHAIPPEVKNLNVTMGFPLQQTPAFTLLQLLLDMNNSRGDSDYVMFNKLAPVLRHKEVIKRLGSSAGAFLDYLNNRNRFYVRTLELDEFIKENSHDLSDSTKQLLNAIVKPVGNNPMEMVNWLIFIMKNICYNYRNQANSDYQKEGNNYAGLYEEALYRVVQILTQIHEVLEKNEKQTNKMDLSVHLLTRLLYRVLGSATINFSGEPARGMQIMGFLEARNLDFKHLLLLSVNEGDMPKTADNTSFIPYNLRVAYGLPTVEHEDALYAYNFYRLLHRPLEIQVLYNATPSDACSGEPSRFLRQLKAEYQAYSKVEVLPSQLRIEKDTYKLDVPKTDEVIRQIKSKYGDEGTSLLSPSALNTYIECPLHYYYHYIKGLDKQDDFDENMDNADFGNVFHKAMQLIYSYIFRKPIEKSGINDCLSEPILNKNRQKTADWNDVATPEKFKDYVWIDDKGNVQFNDDNISKVLSEAFKEELFIEDDSQYTGEQLIKRDVLQEMIQRQLSLDIKNFNDSWSFYKPEYLAFQPVEVELKPIADGGNTEKINIWLGGIIDRRDGTQNLMRVVDYKTGSSQGGARMSANKGMDELFGVDAEGNELNEQKRYIFQTMLYACLLHGSSLKYSYGCNNKTVQPVLMFPRDIKDGNFEPSLTLSKNTILAEGELEQNFMDRLKATLTELLNPNIPFKATSVDKRCTFCSMAEICHREPKKMN